MGFLRRLEQITASKRRERLESNEGRQSATSRCAIRRGLDRNVHIFSSEFIFNKYITESPQLRFGVMNKGKK